MWLDLAYDRNYFIKVKLPLSIAPPQSEWGRSGPLPQFVTVCAAPADLTVPITNSPQEQGG